MSSKPDVYTLTTFLHYEDHVLPIVEALRQCGVTVQMLSTNKRSMFGQYVHPKALPTDGLWITAGHMDAAKLGDRRYVYVEHGAGQTYEADARGVEHPSYSTGQMPGNPVLFLCPNEFVAARRRRMHPEVPAVVVGYPKLDHLHAFASGHHDGVETDVVAFAWHWDCQVVPEAHTAWEHYRSELVHVVLELHRHGLRCVSTAHPRIAKRIRYHIERLGMTWWEAEDVLTRAAVLCADNTSLMYEFASLDRPVVVMNAPWYRREVHHGLRFWECLPGNVVDDAGQLPMAIDDALTRDDPSQRSCVERIIPIRDGKAAWRAAEAIIARV